jgi:hypothetical protein
MVWGPPPNVYIFEAPGLHFWRFIKQIRKQITYISTNNKQNTFPLDYIHLQDPSTVHKQTELPLHCVRNCGGRQSLNNRSQQ